MFGRTVKKSACQTEGGIYAKSWLYSSRVLNADVPSTFKSISIQGYWVMWKKMEIIPRNCNIVGDTSMLQKIIRKHINE